jgi:hypothetical protein
MKRSVLVFGVLSAVLIVLATTTASGQSIQLSPTSGPVGATVTINGYGFGAASPGLSIYFNITFENTSLVSRGLIVAGPNIGTCLPDVNGNFSCSVTVPPQLPGTYPVTATFGILGDQTASANFTILDGELHASSAWTTTSSYPGPILGPQCVSSDGYVYCVGGDIMSGCNDVIYTCNYDNFDQSYFAPLSASGVGTWVQTTSFGPAPDAPDSQNPPPTTPISGHQCVAWDGYVYCIGGDIGYLGNTGFPDYKPIYGGPTSRVAYAPISSDGIGTWQLGSPYDLPQGANWFNDVLQHLKSAPSTIIDVSPSVDGHSCVVDSGYIYCVGGNMSFSIPSLGPGYNRIPTNVVVYAPITSSHSVGPWQYAGEYGAGAVTNHSCVAHNGYIYCVGGQVTNDQWWQLLLNPFPNTTPSSEVWFAQLLPGSGVGPWQQTTSFGGGRVENVSCSVVIGNIVCVGGSNGNGGSNNVWAAPLLESGVGQWSFVGVYPSGRDHWEQGSCVTSSGKLYCIGGGSPTPPLDSAYGGANSGVNFASYAASVKLHDAGSCAELSGTWNGSSSACTVASNLTVDPGTTVEVQSGVTLAIGDASSCVPSQFHDCTGMNAATFTNNGQITIDFGATFVNNSGFYNIGIVLLGGTFDNRGNLSNTGSFVQTGIDAAHNGYLANEGSITNAGLFAANLGGSGGLTVVVNNQTCQNTSPLVASDYPLMVYGSFSASTCTLDPPPGLAPGSPGIPTFVNLVDPTVLPSNVVWQIPYGTTLLIHTELDVQGTLDNSGTVITQPTSTAGAIGSLLIYNQFLNTGTLNNQGGLIGVAITGTLTNQGSIAGSGEWVAGNLLNLGMLTVQSGGLLYVNGPGTLTNSGNITINQGATLSDLGILNNSGTVNNSGTISDQNSALASIVNEGSGSIVNQNGGTTNGLGGTLTGIISAPVIELTESWCVTIGGSWLSTTSTCVLGQTTMMDLNEGLILKIDPGVTLENYGVLGAPGKIDNYGKVINNNILYVGSINFPGNQVYGGLLVNESGASLFNYNRLITDPGTKLANFGTFTNAASNGFNNAFDNQGAFDNAGAVNNYGTIENDGTHDNFLEGAAYGASINNLGTIANLCHGSFFAINSAPYSGALPASGGCNSPSPVEPTMIIISSSTQNPSYVGELVTLTATVTPFGSATGSVTFFDGSTSLGTVAIPANSGQVTLSTSAIGAGMRAITAQYSGCTRHMKNRPRYAARSRCDVAGLK